MKSVIRCQQVSKSFAQQDRGQLRYGLGTIFQKKEQQVVLKDIDFKVLNRETVGFYGANGSGKTTLFKLIAGILQPDSGVIKVNGRISAVLELGAGLHPDLTGRENIELYGTLMGFAADHLVRVESQIIEFAKLSKKINSPVGKYSSGMKSRLAFSIAAFSDADILLLDEVFAVGDREFLDKSRTLMKKLKKDKTILLSSHNLQLLQSFCSRIIKIQDGKIDLSGKLYELLLELPIGASFQVQVISNSMFPLIKAGDKVEVIRMKWQSIKDGDVVAVYFANIQEVVIHRVIAKEKNKNLILRGDNNDAPDQWLVGKSNLLGKVVL